MNDGWFERRTHHWTEWTPQRLVGLKRETGTTVSLVVPARNEETTVGGIVSGVREELVERVPLLDELVVMDSDSTDATACRAADAGARVHRTVDVRPDLGHYRGKGEALWKAQFVTEGDILVFLDADLVEWDTHFVSGLLGPLLQDSGVELVKAFYDRILDREDARPTHEGGRVTELVARPTLALRWPELSGIVQPLSGEWAIRRRLLCDLTVPTGYGVELAALVDTHLHRGVDAIAQVGMGLRGHHHQSLHGLGAMATELLAVADRRSGAGTGADTVELHQYGTGGKTMTTEVGLVERGPARRVGPPSDRSEGQRAREVAGWC
ncbi:glucosyl-3-phosphoglycerate synthase [Nocardiopsis kunsanensis]|uniref:Glucosyl-3-phosphoglycerate synthase n=1 Tax=Nocardiopsis kunsanensis TaxID=141693 RepID=A0A919CEK6_9ACTN|nr:glucosyl-3-phosphoglycerate synthase [Nocardiopsis kunsanensis]GHD15922.1 glucosyl-3-phosphoglycerate synthase [Nocardiopsis kunsanensis]